MKHTPGPWIVFNQMIVKVYDDTKNHGWTLIADIHPPSNIPGEADANARLIAAAPKLLEMCEELIYHMTHSMDCKHGNGFTYDFCPVEKARRIITEIETD